MSTDNINQLFKEIYGDILKEFFNPFKLGEGKIHKNLIFYRESFSLWNFKDHDILEYEE